MRKLRSSELPVLAIDDLVEVLLQLWGRHLVKQARQNVLYVRVGGVHLRKPFVHPRGRHGT